MGGGASKNRGNKKIIPQFTVTIVINNEAIVAIDVCEDATLADARKEILLESEDFSNLPTSDPGIAGRVFRQGTDLKISTGGV